MKYKKSKYNIFVPYNNEKTIIFNSLSGSIGLFNNEVMEKYKNKEFNNDETELLLKKGILIDNDYNELEKINNDRARGIIQNKNKYIRIWTTSACNARCYYCFEKGIPVSNMTEKTADQLVIFLDNMMKKDDTLTFEWFGGEPLLNTKIIDYIIEKMLPLSKKKDYKLSSTIISNGSLINEDIVNKMINLWNIKYIQITLDGDEILYNKTKDYLNPKKHNFNNVINGIKLLSEKKIHVSIRMNYDTTNFESIMNLIDYLHDELKQYKNIFYYVYPIWSSLNEDDDNSFCSDTIADKNLVLIFEKIVKYHMTPIREIARLNYKQFQCVSCNINSYTIFPDGKIGKCSETFKQTIGDIWKGVTNKEIYDFWSNTDIEEKCKNCIYLPLCQGGCRSSYFTKMPQCFAYKNILPDVLKWYVENIKQ